jgi:hypothetical protein
VEWDSDLLAPITAAAVFSHLSSNSQLRLFLGLKFALKRLPGFFSHCGSSKILAGVTPNFLAAALVVSPLANATAVFRRRVGSSQSQFVKSIGHAAMSAGVARLCDSGSPSQRREQTALGHFRFES